MLGMEDDNRTACQCCELSECALGSVCECGDYCFKYKDIYNRIDASTKKCWLTISPKPHELEDDASKLRDWLNDFYDLRKCCKDLIVSVEYTSKMIMHFHIFIAVTDIIKFKKGFLQRWYFKANIEPIWGRCPKEGIHYLFKTSTEVETILEEASIFTMKDLKLYSTNNPTLRRMFSATI